MRATSHHIPKTFQVLLVILVVVLAQEVQLSGDDEATGDVVLVNVGERVFVFLFDPDDGQLGATVDAREQ